MTPEPKTELPPVETSVVEVTTTRAGASELPGEDGRVECRRCAQRVVPGLHHCGYAGRPADFAAMVEAARGEQLELEGDA
jgi:hypothetical protein